MMELNIAPSTEGSTTKPSQPGHDIFCTPKNDAFYRAKRYSKLDPLQQEIRLVRLSLNTGDGPLECELLPPTKLSNVRGKYSAPSYCAGSASNTKQILLNDKRFNVFANLEHALREIQGFWNKTFAKECLLWVDQISINQMDIGERSHQVGFMRDIYENAEQVLACLSTEASDPSGMKWSMDLANELFELPALKPVPYFRFGTSMRYRQVFDSKVPERGFLTGCISFYKSVVQAPWWTRAWVFQEFIVAPEVYFLYSGTVVCLSQVAEVWSQLCNWLCLSKSRKHMCFAHDEQARRPGPALRTMKSMLEANLHHGRTLHVTTLLEYSRHCKASDARDKVFAFVGLNQAYGIQPDYSYKLAQLFVDTTMKIIQTERTLDILHYAAISRHPRSWMSAVPTWVVDWTWDNALRASALDEFLFLHRWKFDSSPKWNVTAFIESSRGCTMGLRVLGIPLYKLLSEQKLHQTSGWRRIGWRRWGYPSLDSREKCMVLPDFVEEGDEVWVVYGCGSQLVLRLKDESEYALIFAACLDNSVLPDAVKRELWLESSWVREWKESDDWQTILII